MEDIETKLLFDLSHSIAGEYLSHFSYPWQALPGLRDFISTAIFELPRDEFYEFSDNVWVAKSADIAPSAVILPYTIIGRDTQVRTGAFIRGSVIVGDDCVIGNSVEVKNSIIFDCCDVPHFNYVGDSVLGYRSHMGAGAVTSNIKSDKTNVTVRNGTVRVQTGLRKMGAILGDGVEVGCNTTLNPGTVVGRCTTIYPNSCVRGAVPKDSIYKNADSIVKKISKE